MSKTEIILFIVSMTSLGLALYLYKQQNPKEQTVRYVDTSTIKTREEN